ncbi:MAG TPA: aldehyde ferredoxin oxidoreductase family protein [Symbiobacteriaceae bacterium]|nr:aldehyde ferredoxin oxidoreductase family protein [Symbiobacteriaceae bacterium]
MALGGYAHRLAHVDLTAGSVSYSPIPEDLIRKYIGGRGLGVKYVFDNGPKVDALSPDNLLAIMNGPVTGSPVNLSGRLAVVTKSPLTGTVTDSHMGGFTAARLRWAGFDGLLIKGKAATPTYLLVENGQVSLHDASSLWGLGVRATVKALREKHSKDAGVMAIGPAGERLVRFAAWMNEDDRASGRGGTGAVGGSKNLKAIVIVGDKKNVTRPIEERKAAFDAAQKAGLKAIMNGGLTAPNKGGLSVYGTNVLTNILNEAGSFPAFNGKASHFEQAYEISGEAFREHLLVSEPVCHACPVACKKELEVKEGRWKVRTESMEYETAWSLGAMCGCHDREAMAYMLDQCNDYGVDTIEMGVTLAMAMEASELKLTEEVINWGDAEKMSELIRQTAYREGLGDTLAGGAAGAAERLGNPDIAMSVKGQAIPAYDPRGVQGIGLGYATSNRGGCHVRGYTIASEIAGIPFATDRTVTEGKAALLKIFQDLFAFTDSMDVCKFATFSEGAQEFADQVAALTGLTMGADELMRIGERIYNLERHYNNLNGFTGKDDTLPKRFLTEPATGNSAGMLSHLPVMLKEYYELRGWVDGVVTEAKLKELEIV